MNTKKITALLLIVALFPNGFAAAQPVPDRLEADIVIYGGTSAAVIAGVQAKKLDKSVVIISPDKHLGGLSSGGLGWTDSGNKSVIGGLSREFYERIFNYYDKPETWKWQDRSEYSFRGRVMPPSDSKDRSMWIFEPHIAEQVFEDLIAEYKISVYRDEWLDRMQGVHIEGGHISSITTLSGKSVKGKVFIDATYEGDLMAEAGISYHIGREANSVYDENWNGIQVGVLHHDHHFGELQVSPYNTPGDPSSGLIPKVSAADPGNKGDGDQRVQAYCFRMCLTDHPDNLVPFPKPAGYDPNQYELLLRIFDAGLDPMYVLKKFDLIPNQKTDTNNHGPFSFDNIGMNWDYPEASYERRREIIEEHRTYQQGLLYFICTDPRVPDELQQRMNTWGLAKDEFVDNGNWPHQLYIREARRMIGEYVTTENDVQGNRQPPKPIAMGSYTMDSHNVQRYITPEGFLQNEGDIGVNPKKPYQIAYGSIIPKQDQCENLLVPVCVSSSHIAFGSIRMEPVFMVLGQSAATAASLALDHKVPVQNVPYSKLREQLLSDGQVLERLSKPKKQAKTLQPRIVCFGDSITKRGYPGELATLLGVEVLNSGVAGNTTRHGLRRLQKDLLDYQPEVAVMLFGTNDSRLAEEHVHVPLDQFSANLSEMIEACLDIQIQVVVCTLPPIDAEPYFQRHSREKFKKAGGLAKVLEDYRKATLQVAEKCDVPTVDLHRVLEAHRGWLHTDGVHPSQQGNSLIAQLVASELKQVIESKK